ncbi:uncharacterized protein B0H18DRAFT_1006379 [Fomitopsis serialis]|uniref:uncharacterized protein n=1 Tax=Fomitopsis serialis TaxID=139415 RepID=UPI0020085428|nr:uncharacterized protein B0H18DRAFT_1006379 [Neoantrodia serialis]KAH9926486.1 hypothetical protein B0H18DRAFT_1006379 [Neoantrodia serialis]
MLKDVAKNAIVDFLQKMNVPATPKSTRNPALESRVKEITQTWPSPSPSHDHTNHHIVTGVVMTEASYSHLTSIDAQVAIALYTALMVALDDPEVFGVVSAHKFPQMLCDGSAHQDRGLLGELARLLVDMGRLFPAFGINCIISSTMRWFAGEMISNPSTPSFLEPRSKSFVDLQRSLSGDPEAYAAFIWDKADFSDETSYIHIFPEACIYVNHVKSEYGQSTYTSSSDILSGDDTYLRARSRVTGQATYDTLREVIDEVVAAVERIREHLGTGPARDAWDSFEAGYIWFHIGDPRYRLQEVIGTDYMMDSMACEACEAY